MADCPQCQRPIPFRTILFASFPVWITCPHCGAKLIGSMLIKIQGFVFVPLLALVLAFTATFIRQPLLVRLAFVALAAFLIAIPNVFIALAWGRYLPRGK